MIASPTFTLESGSHTDPGRQRSVNQDAHCVLDLAAYAPSGDIAGLFVVADGMGGHEHGEQASNYVIQELSKLFGSEEHRSWAAERGIPEQQLALILKESIAAISTQIYEAATSQSIRKMGTTVTAALLHERQLLIGHVGDSRAYLVRQKQITQLTRDHSWVNELLEQGVLTEEQAKQHQGRNIVTRSVGTDLSVQVDAHEMGLQPDDILFLCTDGLSNSTGAEDILQMLLGHPSEVACKKLVEIAMQRDGSDNITCVAVKFLTPQEVPPKPRSQLKWIWLIGGVVAIGSLLGAYLYGLLDFLLRSGG